MDVNKPPPRIRLCLAALRKRDACKNTGVELPSASIRIVGHVTRNRWLSRDLSLIDKMKLLRNAVQPDVQGVALSEQQYDTERLHPSRRCR
ncbi:hypothetical protein OUZ56_022017 [Daphnia magna]|uniref:Uncharacterized protein n=1 Tax=Daphnia magna TaxID=35525 RepID=A0ABR0AV58_9CRUS|nr:hypothetical protein OUZ56_022017 [Daphnia magna]